MRYKDTDAVPIKENGENPIRDRLNELLRYAPWDRDKLADYLLANGVIVQANGEWEDIYKGKYANCLYKCSVCGEPAYGNGKVWFFSKFCPSCGAKMGALAEREGKG
jgi:rubrerythrin